MNGMKSRSCVDIEDGIDGVKRFDLGSGELLQCASVGYG
jgi:hypothetical protein